MQEEPMLLCESPPPSQEEGSKVVERVPLHYTSIVTPLYLHCNSIVPCFTLHSWCKLVVHIISSVFCVMIYLFCALWRALGYDHNLPLLGTRSANTRGRQCCKEGKIIYARKSCWLTHIIYTMKGISDC